MKIGWALKQTQISIFCKPISAYFIYLSFSNSLKRSVSLIKHALNAISKSNNRKQKLKSRNLSITWKALTNTANLALGRPRVLYWQALPDAARRCWPKPWQTSPTSPSSPWMDRNSSKWLVSPETSSTECVMNLDLRSEMIIFLSHIWSLLKQVVFFEVPVDWIPMKKIFTVLMLWTLFPRIVEPSWTLPIVNLYWFLIKLNVDLWH